MPLDSNSSSSSSSSNGHDRNPNSDQSTDPKPNPDSIDQSLDAIESQLASISMSSRSPTTALDGEGVLEEEAEEQLEEELNMGNGPLKETEGAAGDELIESNWKPEASGGIDERPSSSLSRNALEAEELERSLSPGSTSGSYEIIDDAEDGNEFREVENDWHFGFHTQWVSGKHHPGEDDASVSWRKRKKHFFILSNSENPSIQDMGMNTS